MFVESKYRGRDMFLFFGSSQLLPMSFPGICCRLCMIARENTLGSRGALCGERVRTR